MGLNTGHPGFLTTTHANSATAAFERIASLIKNSEVGQGLERSEIRRELHQALDVVLYMAEWKVTEIFYDPIFKREELTGKGVTGGPEVPRSGSPSRGGPLGTRDRLARLGVDLLLHACL